MRLYKEESKVIQEEEYGITFTESRKKEETSTIKFKQSKEGQRHWRRIKICHALKIK